MWKRLPCLKQNGQMNVVNFSRSSDSSYEGLLNLYFTNARARKAMHGGLGLIYDSIAGIYIVDTSYLVYKAAASGTFFPISGGATLSATNGSGFIGFHPQLSAVTPPADGCLVYDSLGFYILRHDRYRRGLHWTGISHNTDYYYPVTIYDDTLSTMTSPSTFTNKTISGNNNYFSNIANSSLTNSSITVQGNSVSLGGSVNPINGTGFVKASGTTLNYDNSTYLTTGSAASIYEPIQSASNIINQYLTGYKTWGILPDTVKSYFNATSPLSYNQATGNISHGSASGYKVLWNNSSITNMPNYNYLDTPSFGGLWNNRVQTSLTANGLNGSLFFNYSVGGYSINVGAPSATNTTGAPLTIQGGTATGANQGGNLNLYGGSGGSGGPGNVYLGNSQGSGNVYIQGSIIDISHGGPSAATLLTLGTNKWTFAYDVPNSLLKTIYNTGYQAQFLTASSYYFDNSVRATTFNSATTQTTLSGTTSGNAVFSMPFQGSSYKKVIVYCNALTGTTTTYTFPTSFTYTPGITNSGTNGYPASFTPTISTTGLSLSGTSSSGWVILEGY